MAGETSTEKGASRVADNTPVARSGAADVRSTGDGDRLPDGEDGLCRGGGRRTLPELLTSAAERYAGRPAVLSAASTLTFAELAARANRLARLLIGRGAGPERVVALLLPRSVDIVVAQWAVAMTGAAFIPIDPRYPAERIALMMSDAGPVAVLTRTDVLPGRAGAASAGSGVGPLILLDDAGTAAALRSLPAGAVTDAERTAPLRAAHPAYVIYTSGSTGRPKGVLVPHAGLESLAAAARDRCAIRPGDRILQFSSPAFDASIAELCMSLLNGAALVIGAPGPLLGDELAGALRRWEVTHALIPPAALATVPAEAARDDLPGFRGLLVGGEACSAELVARWAPGRRMINAYGPTECTVICTWSGPLAPTGPPPIGRPGPDTRAYLLDSDLRPVPAGATGELYIGGAGLARGYLNRPGLTAQRFVADPFGPAGSRMYRTGDRARRTAGGELEFAGRADDQVKIRGFRVEPGEVEAALVGHHSVAAAAVVARADQPGQPGRTQLVAYVVAADGFAADAAVLRAHLARLLPEHQIPAAFVPLETLPLNPQGKVDRRALPAPGRAARGAAEPPRTDAERVLAGIWADCLGVPEIGVHDDFFALGGDSIRTVMVLSRVRAAFGTELPVRTLFDAPTVARFALLLPTADSVGAGSPDRPPPPGARLPLSPAQRRLRFLDNLAPGAIEHNTGVGVRLTGPLQVAALRTALAGLAGRHRALRTTFDTVGGHGVQVVAATGGIPLRELAVAGLDTASVDAALDGVLAEELRRPFDLGRGPLTRALLVRLADDDHVLLLCQHHIITDGWSARILVAELIELYAAAVGDRAPLLPGRPPDPVVPPDEDGDPALRRQLSYWRDRLAGAPVLELPTDRPRPRERSTAGAAHRRPLPADLRRRLTAVAQSQGATLFMALTAAVQIMLSRYGSQRDVVLGTVTSGRDRMALERLVGFFVNIVVLRDTVPDAAPFSTFLAQVRETVVGALTHGQVPFDRLVDELHAGRDPGSTPLVRILAVLHDESVPQTETAGLRITEHDLPRPAAEFDVVFHFQYRAAALNLTIEYNSDLFQAATIDRMARHLETLLDAIATDPHTRLRDLPLLTATDRELLGRWGSGAGSVPCRTVPDVFAEMVESAPDAPAVVCGEMVLTYAELDRWSGWLAGRLADSGVAVEKPVALLMRPSVPAVVAELAVLKAGAVYVPLDVRAPVPRLRQRVVELSGSLVVTVPEWAGLAAELGARDVVVLTDDRPPVPEPAAEPVRSAPDSAAYVMWTSGSAGGPKGVVVRHRDIVGLAGDPGFDRVGRGRVLAHSPLAFDASTFEVWVPLLRGGTVVVTPAAELDEQALRQAVTRHAVTGLWLTAGVFAALARVAPDSFTGLREVWTGGDVVPAAAVRRVLAACPGLVVVDGYGPTETTTFATTSRTTGTGPVPEVIPIGRPLAGTHVYVLDNWLRPTPIGVPGELFIAGTGLARGYWHRPGLTATHFLANPFDSGGARMYATGDIVRWTSDGELEFIGRADDQIKIRGFRVEPGEIEAALQHHPDVAEATVLGSPDNASGSRQLHAYVVPRTQHPPDCDALRGYLTETLPDYLVPATVTAIDRLPLTPQGKVDRNALPAPHQAARAQPHQPPTTPAERLLTQIWSTVLGHHDISIHDNFFALGGDSIISIQIASQAHQAGLAITPKDLFDHPTIHTLASHLGSTTEVRAPVADRGPVTGPVPLTPIQRWFLRARTDHPEHFNQSARVWLADRVDEDVVRTALAALIEHHDALRMRFEHRVGQWRQYCAPVRPADVLCPGTADGPFDLGTGPLLRAALPGDGSVSLTAHHLVVDGVSWRILLEDLATAYRQAAAGAPVRLGARTTSFQEWATRLADYAGTGGFAGEREYWSTVGADAGPAAQAPAPGPAAVPAPSPAAGQRSVAVRLDPDLTRALLRDVPPVYRTQVNDVLLAALARVLCRWTGRPRVLVELEGHGREEVFEGVDLSRTVGWFTTLYPVGLELPGLDGWGAALRSVKEQLRAVPHRGLGFGVLRELTDPALPVAAAQVRFNYLGQLPTRLHADASPDAARADLLEVVGAVTAGCLELTWHYPDGAHDRSTVRRLAEEMVTALREIVEHCARPGAGGRTPSDFPLAALDQTTVDRLVGDGRAVEDVCPLTPMQAGMVFHSLVDGAAGAYVNQVQLTLSGIQHPAVLGAAWQRVVDRTPALRGRVVWQGLDRPLLLVQPSVTVPVAYHDWTGLPADRRLAERDLLLAADRSAGLDLAGPSLQRLAVVTLPGEEVLLVWTFHHVLLDGWSAAHVVDEVCTQYASMRHGREPSPLVRRPFQDHLRWLAERDPAPAEAYWRGVLAGWSAPTPLPADRPATEAHAARSDATVTAVLPPDQSARLRDAARRRGLTVNTIVQGAWALLLSHFSGERDVMFGTTVAGRPAELPGAVSMIGMFVNTLPTRVTVDNGQDVSSWLRGLQLAQAESSRFDFVPLTRLQQLAGGPLFDSILAFENYPFSRDAAPGRPAIREVRAVEPTNCPLTAVVYPGDELVVALHYDPRRFDGGTARRLADHMRMLLVELGSHVDGPLRAVATLTEVDRESVEGWAGGGRGPAPVGSVPAGFAAVVERVPDAPAVVCGELELSYAELDAWSNRLAQRLIASGVGAAEPVALLMGPSVAAVVAELAVLKAGGAYAPLDVRAPVARLRQRMAELAGSVLMTVGEWAGLAARLGAREVVVVAEDRAPAGAPAGPPGAAVDPESAAYLMWTSGSAGGPKGVVVRHRDIVGLAADPGFAGVGQGRVLMHSPLAFDASTFELWVPLLRGGAVVIAPAADLDERTLRQVVARHGVTGGWLTAGVFAALARVTPDCFAGLREVWTGGDVVPAAAVRRVLAACPGLVVVDGYGPTETTTFATAFRVTGGDPVPDVIPIGRPLAGTHVYVLDSWLRPVPVGVPGELFIAGVGVARGYWNRPGLTAARFLADPFAAGTRMYATGDIARWTATGDLEFIGRADDQIKIRGFRVEPGEVEAALLRHPDIAEATVAGTPDANGTKRLHAYIVPRSLADPPDPADLRGFLAGALPDYLVPDTVTAVDRLPLTAHGKVDRSALPPPRHAAPTHGYEAPATATEHLLTRIWSGALQHERIGVHDDFFALGGDSVISIQIVAQAHRAGLTLTPKDLFQHPTIHALAAHLATTRPTPAPAPAGGPAGGPVTGDVPLTPVQHWFLDRDQPEPERFSLAWSVELAADVDAGALRTALAALVEHHDALRMRFERAGAGWRQHNAPVAPAEILHTGAGPAGRFDLRHGPLLSAALDAGTDGHRPVLTLTVHHLVADVVSGRILLADLDTAYRQAAAGRPVRLGPRTSSFRDWARRLADHAATGGFAEEREYWAAVTAGAAALPADRTGPNTVASMRSITVGLSAAATGALLRDVPPVYRTRIDDVLLTALGRVLHRWTGRDRVLIDLERHGREELWQDVDLSRTVGWFTSIVPVALTASAQDWGTALKAVKEQLRAIPRGGLGYAALRYLAGAPVPDPAAGIGVNYLGQTGGTAGSGGLFRGAPAGPDAGISPAAERAHLLDVVGRVDAGCLHLTWYYSQNRHQESTVRALADDLVAALHGIVEHCARPGAGGRTPADFPLAGLDQAGVDRLAADGRSVEDIYPLTPMQAGMLFHSLVDGSSGAYLNQMLLRLSGVADPQALGAAWQRVVDRTPVLRCRVVWEGVDRPLQVVQRAVPVPVTHHDWTGLDEVGWQGRRDRLLADDRARGLDLSTAPLLRLAIARLPADVLVVWTFHHLLMDGWSAARVFASVAEEYAAIVGNGRSRPPAEPPFRNYLRWLAEQDQSEAVAYWRRILTGFRCMTTLPFDQPPADTRRPAATETIVTGLSAEQTGQLRAAAQRTGLTLNTVVQGAWGVLLWCYSGDRDVVFGSTVSGRPADLAGVESMVGMFINTVPVRLTVHDGAPVVPWLRGLQADQSESRRFDFLALAQIRGCGEVPAGTELFDSIVAFENYPFDPDGTAAHGIVLRGAQSIEPINYPLAVVVLPGEELSIRLDFDPAAFRPATVRRVGSQLRALLVAIAARPDARIADIVELAGVPRLGVTADRQRPPPPPEAATPAESAAGGTYVAPRTDAERVLAGIWTEVLGMERIGVDDDFFELGGDSISSLRITSRTKTAFAIPLSPADVLTTRTISLLGELVEAKVIAELEHGAAVDGDPDRR
jgi:amino acid adenylation domain-containing protein/non-ribosomal peptide synthase protein (TIGR01720 family)